MYERSKIHKFITLINKEVHKKVIGLVVLLPSLTKKSVRFYRELAVS